MCQCHTMMFHQLGPHDWRSRTGKLIETAKRLIKWETSLSTAAYKISKCTDFSSCGYRCVMSSRWCCHEKLSSWHNNPPKASTVPFQREVSPPSIHHEPLKFPKESTNFCGLLVQLPSYATTTHHRPKGPSLGTRKAYHILRLAVVAMLQIWKHINMVHIALIMHLQGCFKTFQKKSRRYLAWCFLNLWDILNQSHNWVFQVPPIKHIPHRKIWP